MHDRLTLGLLAVALLSGCATDAPQDPSPRTTPASALPSPTSATTDPSASPSATPSPLDGAQATRLRRELVAMARRDQRERSGGALGEGDQARTDRLREIIETYGWPTIEGVGKEAADAAWLIAQHSDLDPAFQREALELITAAAAQGQASPGNVAYLDDRVAVAEGRPQRYGTQITCDGAQVELRTPLVDARRVDRLRESAGLDPLQDYFDELKELCATPQ